MATGQTCIFVLGMHRSGTSATAGALGLCGVALGEDLLAPGADNPKGYFEHERAVDIDERLLAAVGSGWADARPLPPAWQGGAAAAAAAGAIRALVDSEFADAPLFALKDPRMCRLMPAWLAALQARGTRAVALFVARDPSEVAASIEARNGWAPPLGELLWLRYTREAEAATRGIARAAIAYDALLADPAGSLQAALARVDVALPAAPEAALRAFADAGDRHQRKAALARGTHMFAGPVAHARDALDAIAAGADAWDAIAAAGAALDEAWLRSGGTLDALAGMAVDVERKASARLEAMAAENSRLNSGLIAQVAWSEAAVVEREALQAEVGRLQSGLTAQVRWSEQAVADWERREAEALAAYQAEIARHQAELARAHATIAAIQATWSWRLTRPLRAAARLFQRNRNDGKA